MSAESDADDSQRLTQMTAMTPTVYSTRSKDHTVAHEIIQPCSPQAGTVVEQTGKAHSADSRSDIIEEKLEVALAPFAPRLRRFLPALATQLHNTAMCDVILHADGMDFPCHRLALACSSEYFARMFEEWEEEAPHLPPHQPLHQTSLSTSTTLSACRTVKLHGRTAQAVQAMLRIMYFEATALEVLHEEPRLALHVLELANAWYMQDVHDACIEFVKKMDSIDDLEWIAASVTHHDSSTKLREMCHDRLRILREALATKAAVSDLQALGLRKQAATREDRKHRWPATALRKQEDKWTAPMRSPRAFGW